MLIYTVLGNSTLSKEEPGKLRVQYDLAVWLSCEVTVMQGRLSQEGEEQIIYSAALQFGEVVGEGISAPLVSV